MSTPPLLSTTRRRWSGAVDPLRALAHLRRRHGDAAFLLESAAGPSTDARTTIVGVAGAAEVAVHDRTVTLRGEDALVDALRTALRVHGLATGAPTGDGDVLRLTEDDALWRLAELVVAVAHGDARVDDAQPAETTPTELLSAWGWDAVRYAEDLPAPAPHRGRDAPPAVWHSLVRAALVVDVRTGTAEVVSHEGPGWTAADTRRFVDGLACLDPARDADDEPPPDVPRPLSVVDETTREDWLRRARTCAEHVLDGDLYQVQLGHEVRVRTRATPEVVLARLRHRDPSPYTGLVAVEGRTLVAASPELFVRTDGRRAVLRPIAGTAPGGPDDPGRAPLGHDPKERAEHVMLVDLCRNDLGRVATTGTVEVTSLLAVEPYAHLHHLVSTVEADLEPGTSLGDVVRACFPAGTMAGAPKVEAVSVIDALETSPRGLYAGAFGLVGRGGTAVLGLTIRAAVREGDEWVLRASAGIVAGSTPEGEWRETLLKMTSPWWAVTGEEPS